MAFPTREITKESGIDTIVSYLICFYSNTGIHKWYDDGTDVPTKVMQDFACEPIGGQLYGERFVNWSEEKAHMI